MAQSGNPIAATVISVTEGGTKLKVQAPPKGYYAAIDVTTNGRTQRIQQNVVVVGAKASLTSASAISVDGEPLPAGVTAVGVNAKNVTMTFVKGKDWTGGDDTTFYATAQSGGPVALGRPTPGQPSTTVSVPDAFFTSDGALLFEAQADAPADPTDAELLLDRVQPAILSFHEQDTDKTELETIAWGSTVTIKVRGNLKGTTWVAKVNGKVLLDDSAFEFQDATTTQLTLPSSQDSLVLALTMTNPGATPASDAKAEAEIAVAHTPRPMLARAARTSGMQPAMHPLEVAIVSALSGEAGTGEVMDQIRQFLESAEWPETAIATVLPKLKKCRSIQNKKDLHAAVHEILAAAHAAHAQAAHYKKSV
jgi:hypothetical protein